MKNELYHYGTKGMKWGTRKYQTSNGTWTKLGLERRRDRIAAYGHPTKENQKDQVIKKGTKLYRVSDSSEQALKDGFYASVNAKDREKYIKKYGSQLTRTGKKAVEKTLTANKDILIPSHQKSMELMNKNLDNLNLKNDPKKMQELKNYFKNDISSENNASDRLYKRAINEVNNYVKTGKVGRNLYDALNVAQADRRSNLIQDISRGFYDQLNNNGYGAVLDLNDTTYGSMKTNMPIVVAKAGSVKISNIRDL